MQVIDHEPHFWFLFSDAEKLVFNVNCENSFVSYDFTLALSPEETEQYNANGKSYLNRLAEEINYSAPGVQGSNSKYKTRYAQSQYEESMREAIEKWRAKP